MDANQNQVRFLLKAANLFSETIELWSMLTPPAKIVSVSGAIKDVATESAFSGKLFYEVDLMDEPFISYVVEWGELSHDAAVYYIASYLLLGLTYVQTMGHIGSYQPSLMVLQSILEVRGCGHPLRTVSEIMAQKHPQLLDVTRRVVALFCEVPHEFLRFVNFDSVKVKKLWSAERAD